MDSRLYGMAACLLVRSSAVLTARRTSLLVSGLITRGMANEAYEALMRACCMFNLADAAVSRPLCPALRVEPNPLFLLRLLLLTTNCSAPALSPHPRADVDRRDAL